MNPNEIIANALVGGAYWELQRPESAIEPTEQELKERMERAVICFLESLKYKPNYKTHLRLGEVFYRLYLSGVKEDIKKSIYHYRKVIEMKSPHVEYAYEGIASPLKAAGDYDGAVEALLEALKIGGPREWRKKLVSDVMELCSMLKDQGKANRIKILMHQASISKP